MYPSITVGLLMRIVMYNIICITCDVFCENQENFQIIRHMGNRRNVQVRNFSIDSISHRGTIGTTYKIILNLKQRCNAVMFMIH